jgi:hypothetical protein
VDYKQVLSETNFSMFAKLRKDRRADHEEPLVEDSGTGLPREVAAAREIRWDVSHFKDC